MKRRLAVAAMAGACALPLVSQATVINVDVDKSGSEYTYSGVGIAADVGTTWNSVPVVQSGSGYITINDCLDSGGLSTGVSLSVDRDSGGTTKAYDSTSNDPNPSDLMRDYGYWDGWTASLSDLEVGAYNVYIFGVNDGANSGSSWTLDASNGGASGSMTGTSRDIFAEGAEGVSYIKLAATVGEAGTLSFTGGGNFNGFQVEAIPEPATMSLVAIVGGGLLLFRRRLKR